ncbi:ribosome small subunit-dependent GTPase A [Halochromatium sp.]
MPRRRLSERQVERIQRIQDRRRSKVEARAEVALAQLDDEAARNGLVVVRHGANLIVEDAEGACHHCVTRQHIGHPVCGDQVIWQPCGPTAGVITAIHPRTTLLSRPSASGQDKPLAANIGLLIIVVAPEPSPTGFLIDQYLIAAERIGVPALILCNKMDLLDDSERKGFLDRFAHYAKIGYPLLPLSLKHDPHLAPLRERFNGRAGILVGQSGVGKSSLIKTLLPDQEVQIGAISDATGLGRHTTSAATSYRLDSGGRLIDSPGVRSFRLGPITRAELEQGFPEFRPFIGRCRFSNCQHQQEPDCAILAANAQGAIATDRLLAFQQLAKTIRRSAE